MRSSSFHWRISRLTPLGDQGIDDTRLFAERDCPPEKDDRLFATRTPGGYLLTPYDPEVEKQLSAGRDIMKRYRDTLRALAK